MKEVPFLTVLVDTLTSLMGAVTSDGEYEQTLTFKKWYNAVGDSEIAAFN